MHWSVSWDSFTFFSSFFFNQSEPDCSFLQFSEMGLFWFFVRLGWSDHFVSKRKYHLVIPMDTLWNKPLDDGVFDIQTHILHGLIHANGFGHLVCINGIEGGSKYLCGREIMDLWDRICTNLQAR